VRTNKFYKQQVFNIKGGRTNSEIPNTITVFSCLFSLSLPPATHLLSPCLCLLFLQWHLAPINLRQKRHQLAPQARKAKTPFHSKVLMPIQVPNLEAMFQLEGCSLGPRTGTQKCISPTPNCVEIDQSQIWYDKHSENAPLHKLRPKVLATSPTPQ
jgi:hypothetical protein